MKADNTRNTFHQEKYFTRVLMQQGRVQLDADWNEQTAILLHHLRTLAADVIGPVGSPAAAPGFGLGIFDAAVKAPNDFVLMPGRIYVNGLLAEINATPIPIAPVSGSNTKVQVAAWFPDGLPFEKNQFVQLTGSGGSVITQITDLNQASLTLTVVSDLSGIGIDNASFLTRITTYQTQPGLPAAAKLPVGTQNVYIDVWERAITYAEDDAIREVALSGPDTAARAKVVWQVRVQDSPSPSRPGSSPPALNSAVNRGYLKAMAKKNGKSTDPCTISPDAQYRGPENQLYRVEIHTGGTASAGATFKWSRENGSVVLPIVRAAGSSALVLENLGRDDRFGLKEDDWLEVEDDSVALLGIANNLLQLQSIDRTSATATLSGPVPITIAANNPGHALLRRWDEQAGDPSDGGLELGPDNAAKIVEDSKTWLSLENGIQIQFQKSASGEAVYRTGDYWLIPARTATGDIEWPRETDANGQPTAANAPLAKPPDGVDHHLALLGTVSVGTDGTVSAPTTTRKQFNPLT
jgi:hypothetical protein